MSNAKEVEKTIETEKKGIQLVEKEYNNGGLLSLTVGKIESDGDWGHGGRTYLKIDSQSYLHTYVCVTDNAGKKCYFDESECKSIEILAGGEWERELIARSLSDVGKYLKDGINKI